MSETCQILACPEYVSMMSLEKNTHFDYYSIYADPMREFIYLYYLFSYTYYLVVVKKQTIN